MNGLKCLIRVQLLGLFGINRIRYEKDKKQRRRMLMFLIGMVLVGVIVCSYSALFAYGIQSITSARMIIPLFVAVVALATLITTIFKTNGVLFGYEDYDQLMSLPVPTGIVIFSRFVVMYLIDLVFSAAFFIPAVVVYAIYQPVSLIPYILMVTVSLLLLPIIPIVIATFVGALIGIVASRFKHKNLITIVVGFGALFAYMYFMSQAANMSENVMIHLVRVISRQIYHIYPVSQWYEEAIVDYNWTSFGMCIGTAILAIVVLVVLMSRFYKSLNSLFLIYRTNGHYKMKGLKTNSTFMALYKKEWKRYVGTPVYLMNTMIGAVLMVGLCIALAVCGSDKLEQILDIPQLARWIDQVAPMGICLCICLVCTTACSVSLEGKNVWILRHLPVPRKTVYLSKMALNLSIIVPSVLISATILSIRLRLSPLSIATCYLAPLLFGLFMTVFGLYTNLLFLSYDWKSETEVVKQGIPTMICSIGSMIIPVAVIVVIVKKFPDYGNLITLGVSGILFVASVILYRLIMKRSF